MKLKYLHDKDPWLLGENIPDCDIFFFQLPASTFVDDQSYKFLKKYKKFLGVYKKFELRFYIGEKNSHDVAESIVAALAERQGFGRDLDRNIMNWSRKLINFATIVDKLPLAKYANRKLWRLYKKHDDIHTKLYTYGWLPVAVDLFHGNFTNRLKAHLRTVCQSREEIEKAFVILTSPTKKTIVAAEREDFLRLYENYYQELRGYKSLPSVQHISSALRKSLARHVAKWGHLGYIYAGNYPAFEAVHYLKEMFEIARSNVDGKKLLKKDAAYLAQAKRKKQALYKKLRVNATYRRLFDGAADFAISKLFRRHAQLFTLHRLHRSLLAEIAKRLKVSRCEAQFMLKDEVKVALLTGGINRRVIKARTKKCTYYAEAGQEVVFTGKRADQIAKQAKVSVIGDVTEITGQTAQPGLARGIVKIIFRAKDMKKMNKGDVLVSIATDPDVVPAMKKAAAIVTDQGGITAHAAIVARELGIPCVIGTKIATKVLKDGDKVEVDATKGIVRKL